VSSLSIVIVAFNSADVIGACMDDLPENAEVVVVDNASPDNSAHVAVSHRPGIRLLRATSNRGFGAGCNLGWRAASASTVAFVNPDVRVLTGALEGLSEALVTAPLAAVGPAMLDESGKPRPCKKSSTPWYDFLALLPAASRWALRTSAQSTQLAPTSIEVPAVEGACFVMRRAALEAISGFDEDFFLYEEEASIAERLRRIGGSAIYEPKLSVVHVGETSTSSLGHHRTRHRYRSRVILYRKLYGPGSSRLIFLLFLLGFVLSLPTALATEILGRSSDRSLRWLLAAALGTVDGYRADLSSGARYPRLSLIRLGRAKHRYRPIVSAERPLATQGAQSGPVDDR
jgi:N-acetylglucosaminyl-diphospho-decaprenol L-rhamnosyltransferase